MSPMVGGGTVGSPERFSVHQRTIQERLEAEMCGEADLGNSQLCACPGFSLNQYVRTLEMD